MLRLAVFQVALVASIAAALCLAWGCCASFARF